jgi:hypothetical protein
VQATGYAGRLVSEQRKVLLNVGKTVGENAGARDEKQSKTLASSDEFIFILHAFLLYYGYSESGLQNGSIRG